MKRIFYFLFILLLAACSSMIHYKDQPLTYLADIANNPDNYKNRVVSFTGNIKGVTEDARHLRFVLKVEVPFYYYATGQGNSLSYQLIIIRFEKESPEMTGIEKDHHVKILARVAKYETRQNSMGEEMGILQLNAFAVTDRTTKKDFYHTQPPELQLYDSWQSGRLFFKETVEMLESLYPHAPATNKTVGNINSDNNPKENTASNDNPIVFEEPEDFIL